MSATAECEPSELAAATATAAATASMDMLQGGARGRGGRCREPASLSVPMAGMTAEKAVVEEAKRQAAQGMGEAEQVAAEVAEMEAAVWSAVAEANASVPSYSRVPPRLVWLLHPVQAALLAMTLLYLLGLYLLWL